MAAKITHIRHQWPVIQALGRSLVDVARARVGRPLPPTTIPGPTLREVVRPRDAGLVSAYLDEVGGDASAYHDAIPPHMFPQWSLPIVSRTLRGVPYDLTRVLNGGCRVTLNGALPLGEPLRCEARLASVDDNGRRAVLHQVFDTGPAAQPDAVHVDFYVIVPLKGSGPKRAPKERPLVPSDAREVGRWRLGPRQGLSFALLTGDFNPIHWVRPIARAAGFKHTILHGFATLARTIEGLNAALFESDPTRLHTIDVRFTRPLTLPAAVGLYVDDAGGVWVGDAPGEPAYLTGTYITR